jgi:5-methylcytosine-specific restriction protein A
VALKDLTRDAVVAAINEFDSLGREPFLAKYGFDQARRLFVIHHRKPYDSKALAGAAHGYLPGQQPLRPEEFSGGWSHAAGVLQRLEFEVVDTVDETTVHEVIGAINRLQPAVVAGRPMLKQAVVLLWAIGRAHRGQLRMLSWHQIHTDLAPLLTKYRRDGERPEARPDYPIAALHRAGLWTLDTTDTVPTAHGDTTLRRWFDQHQPAGGLAEPFYDLVRSSGLARVQVISTIVDKFFSDTDHTSLAAAVGLSDDSITTDATAASDPTASTHPDAISQYRAWVAAVAELWRETDGKRRTGISHDPIRLAAARRAVILRSEGSCENPDCRKTAPDLTDRGDPVLEVDHITDIATGGPDHPIQMIALCPDCHAVKTRGRTRHQLRDRLLTAALERHQAWTETTPTNS